MAQSSIGRLVTVLALQLLILGLSRADVYVHNPRASNNRLNERSAARDNGNRLFDSQNNARGGYNVGEKWNSSFNSVPSVSKNPDGMGDFDFDPTIGFSPVDTVHQYQMIYLEGSIIPIEYTAQHGCGGNARNDPTQQNCNIVLQYMCDTDDTVVTDLGMRVKLRDGSSTNTPRAPDNGATTGWSEINRTRVQNDINDGDVRGRHESEAYYYECSVRNRNRGLFTADENVNGNDARFTRQNPNGNRRGLECAEERDYYPYWGPSPWRDIAVLTDNVEFCNNSLVPHSQNVEWKYKCIDPSGVFTKNRLRHITKVNCEFTTGATGTWVGFRHNLTQPVCEQAHWSRVNHLGNGRDGQPNQWNWTLPDITTLADTGVKIYSTLSGTFARCALRLRYNISTDDYDPWNTFSDKNTNTNTGVVSPVTDDPVVDIGAGYYEYDNQDLQEGETALRGLRLAIDTNQFGRTFQDRTHVFYIKQKDTSVNNLLTIPSARILNLNVRGKRGNIVQTYPSVEYDFAPNRLHVKADDLIHIQWTGSNTHTNGGNAGDGQAGDAGEGRSGTDRHNIVQIFNPEDNYPVAYDKTPANMFSELDCYTLEGVPLTRLDCQIRLAVSGHYQSEGQAFVDSVLRPVNPTLDEAPASLRKGVIVKFKPTAANKMFHYMCTRNNSFSNRSQKGVIIVDP